MDDEDLSFFTNNMKKYLEEICDIYAYSHQINQFQYLVKIKDRRELEKFFYKKKQDNDKGIKNISHNLYGAQDEIPPASYLIFSQEVSNCLNSYAKKFNFRHKRKGGLFADRYSKSLVETEQEMNGWIDNLNCMEKLVFFEEEWKVEEEFEFENSGGECSSKVFYENQAEHKVHALFENFYLWIQDNLRGFFECLPPHSIKALDFQAKFEFYKKIKGVDPPW